MHIFFFHQNTRSPKEIKLCIVHAHMIYAMYANDHNHPYHSGTTIYYQSTWSDYKEKKKGYKISYTSMISKLKPGLDKQNKELY